MDERNEYLWLFFLAFIFFANFTACATKAIAQEPISAAAPPEIYGPWNADVLPAGLGLTFTLNDNDNIVKADDPWTLLAWVNTTDAVDATELIAGMGAPDEAFPRYLALTPGHAMLYMGAGNTVQGAVKIDPGTWHLLAGTFDGKYFRLYTDGSQIAEASILQPGQPPTTETQLLLGSVRPIVEIAPAPRPIYSTAVVDGTSPKLQHFGGKIYGLRIFHRSLGSDTIRALANSHPGFELPMYESASQPWPVQTQGQAGYSEPQRPNLMPHSRAPLQKPTVIVPHEGPAISLVGDDLWRIDGGWRLSSALVVRADGAQISQPAFSANEWYSAVVPGTVLTTLVDRGVYPNPYYGLNNLAIPESLNKQDYWYRTEFRAPDATKGKKLTLTFEGINYQAEIWLNGQKLGHIKGAFIRGIFDVTGILRSGKVNALAVRISPPPHPGIPQEQSIKGGPGANGGMMCLDGPTFLATEGWDWIPAIRDRDSGIWQPVMLRATKEVKIGDPQVVTTLPLPSTSSARIAISVPLFVSSDRDVRAKLIASFGSVTVSTEVELKPGDNTIQMTPDKFPQLDVQHPRLWWPNGYGPANLYHLKLTVSTKGEVSDTKELQFGVREVTYELSLLDPTGHLVRVGFSPTVAHNAGQSMAVIGNTHEDIRSIPAADPPPPDMPAAWRANWHSWVESLTPSGMHSPAITPSDDSSTAPYLVILVNGVRIAARGGNWGMDDAMKDVSIAHLDPYFRLHHDAGENIIRNWVGQSTEENFYDLADKYGFLVWNDFWETTQNYNLEPEDPGLFLKNARDVILRFRNHPSIVVWCGRNEGVPQPIINQGLAKLVRTLDGTRYYSPSSNEVELQNSGPYHYQNPKLYFTALNHGFSVETGSPSMSTMESFKAWTPKADQWPMDDVWAYHDWHFSGNGDTHPFMSEMQDEFGAPTSLADFERKVQMMDYVDYRAIFEGMNAHLWHPNSGRLLWMTQPAWPSNMWEALSWDYDTQSSYYGEKEALQPLHIQLDLANHTVEVVDTTPKASGPLVATADVYSLADKLLLHQQNSITIAADAESTAMQLNLEPFDQDAVVLVELQLTETSGQAISRNLYWIADQSRSFQELSRLPDATISIVATASQKNGQMQVTVQLKNTGDVVALQNKLTLLDVSTGKRILPAYYSDNYVSLLPGESQAIEIEYPGSMLPALTLRGFNLPQRSIAVGTD